MDDWAAAAADPAERLTPTELRRAVGVDAGTLEPIAEMLDQASAPALVVGAEADDGAVWAALVDLAPRNRCAGVPAVPHGSGPLIPPGTRAALITADPAQAHRSPVDVAVIAPLPAACAELARRVKTRVGSPGRAAPARVAAEVPAEGGRLPAEGRLRPADVFRALAAALDADTVVVEESPSSRPDLQRLLPARRPLGFLSAAMGGLGFAVPAAVGVRLACPRRPVVAVVGDGSFLYAPQALGTAAHYGLGALVIVLRNGRYAVMDRLAERQGHPGPWPTLEEVQIAGVASSFGCPAIRVRDHDELHDLVAQVVPTLRERAEPLLVEVDVVDEAHFAP